MLDTLLSLQREIESKMCLTGRQHKLWFLSKKRKMSQTGSVSSLWQKTSDVSLFLFQQQRRLDLLTITNPGEYAYFGLCACVFVIHCTAQHTTQQWILTWGFTDRIVCSHGLVVRALWLLLFSQQASAAPQEQKPAKRGLFPWLVSISTILS